MEILKYIYIESRKMIKKELERITEELLLIDYTFFTVMMLTNYTFLTVMMLLEFIKQCLILVKKILRKVGKYEIK